MHSVSERVANLTAQRLQDRKVQTIALIKARFGEKLKQLISDPSPKRSTKLIKALTSRKMRKAIDTVEHNYQTQKKQLERIQTKEEKSGNALSTTRIRRIEKHQSLGDLKKMVPVMGNNQSPGRKLSYLEELERDLKSEIQGHCYRLQRMQQAASVKEALLYLNLRSFGCSRPNAISFSSKQRCRVDSTPRTEGPSSIRTMKRVNNQKEGVSIKGWQSQTPRYGIEANFSPYKMQEDEIDYDLICSGYERFEKYNRVVNGEVLHKDVVMELERFPPPKLPTLVSHQRSVSMPPQKPVNVPTPDTPSPHVPVTVDTSAPYTPLSMVVSPQEKTPPVKQSEPSIPRAKVLPDLVDSRKIEATCTLTVRSMKPTQVQAEPRVRHSVTQKRTSLISKDLLQRRNTQNSPMFHILSPSPTETRGLRAGTLTRVIE